MKLVLEKESIVNVRTCDGLKFHSHEAMTLQIKDYLAYKDLTQFIIC